MGIDDLSRVVWAVGWIVFPSNLGPGAFTITTTFLDTASISIILFYNRASILILARQHANRDLVMSSLKMAYTTVVASLSDSMPRHCL